VVETKVGYTGGTAPSPTYKTVCAGDGHTEAMKVVYDPAVVRYDDLLERFLGEANLHTAGKPQYASAVWTHTPEQTAAVNAALAKVAEGATRPVTLKVARAGEWTDAEEYHQHYIQKMQAKRGW
jgi:peptide-methionine (S)-S-oxide reductase